MTAWAALIAVVSRLPEPNEPIDFDVSIIITKSLGVETAILYHGLTAQHRLEAGEC